MESPFEQFRLACAILDQVARTSKEFGNRERTAAFELSQCAENAKHPSEMRESFRDAYRLLGAPGDFGYGSPEGDALQDVYSRWNAALQAEKQSAGAP